jgi:hypothetical protein
MEVVVVLARERMGLAFQSVKFESKTRGLGWRDRRGDANLRHHGQNCSE